MKRYQDRKRNYEKINEKKTAKATKLVQVNCFVLFAVK